MFPGQGYGKQVKGVAGDVSDLLAGALRKAIHKVLDEQGDDLVYDSGCLHSLVGGNVALYKTRLLGWLGPGGAYVLEHWGKRHFLDLWFAKNRFRPNAAAKHLGQRECAQWLRAWRRPVGVLIEVVSVFV
jgi:hypothetical protein